MNINNKHCVFKYLSNKISTHRQEGLFPHPPRSLLSAESCKRDGEPESSTWPCRRPAAPRPIQAKPGRALGSQWFPGLEPSHAPQCEPKAEITCADPRQKECPPCLGFQDSFRLKSSYPKSRRYRTSSVSVSTKHRLGCLKPLKVQVLTKV